MRGNIQLWWSFRSLYVPCYSVTTWPVNVPGWLNRHHPGDPGSRRYIAASRIVRPIPGAHPFGASASAVQNCSRQFCLRLIPSGFSGTGGGNIPVKPALSAHPCASPRPAGNASAIYSRTRASLIAFDRVETTLLLLFKNYWGSLSHREREKTTLYSRCRDEKIPQLMKLVADLRRLFELQILRVLHHLPFQLVDFLLQRFRRQHDGILFHH